MQKLLNTKSAAEILGISVVLLERMRVQGRGPAFVALGRRRLYRPEDLDSWLCSNRTDPGVEAN